MEFQRHYRLAIARSAGEPAGFNWREYAAGLSLQAHASAEPTVT
jgi:hypothetical protein